MKVMAYISTERLSVNVYEIIEREDAFHVIRAPYSRSNAILCLTIGCQIMASFPAYTRGSCVIIIRH